MVVFEIGEEYANRKGNYTVIEINDPKMTVEFKDGSSVELSISIQQRIWENIVAEQESDRARTTTTRKKKKIKIGTRFYIRPTTMMTVEELSASSKQVGIPASGRWLTTIKRGDRFIYFAQETQMFFAVVTITGPAKKPKGRGRKKSAILYFPVDVDAYVVDLEKVLYASTIEMESQPNYKDTLIESDAFLEITEDEFELLAEMLTEVSEADEDDDVARVKDDDEFDA